MANNLSGSTTAVFVVTLSAELEKAVTVLWETADGTGKAGVDYEAASGEVTFEPGETAKQIQVVVYGRPEGDSGEDRTFKILLTPPENAILDQELTDVTIAVADEDGVAVTSIVVATGPKGLKGDPGLSAYELAKLQGFTGTLDEWMQDIADAAAAADRAEAAKDETELLAASASDTVKTATEKAIADTESNADRADAAADRAENVKVLGQPYADLTAAQADITAGTIVDGAFFHVMAPDSIYYVDVYRNVAGVATPTGKHIPNGAWVKQIELQADRTDTRTAGIQSTAYSKYLLDILSKNGYLLLGLTEDGKCLVQTLEGKSAVLDLMQTGGIDLSGDMKFDDGSVLTPLRIMRYLDAETDLDGRVVWGTRQDFTKEYMGMPLVTDRGLLSNSLFYIGDSITAFGIAYSGNNNTGTSYAPCLSSLSWAGWAMIMTNGRVRYVGQSATGGYTSEQILNTHVPKAIAAKPRFCVVLAGRNDVIKGFPVEDTIANYKKIFSNLRKADIIPVICTMSAQNNITETTRRTEHQLNNWLRSYSYKYRLPLVDFHAATVDPTNGNWLPGMNQDVSHPTTGGAKLMGKALADGISPWLAPNLPPMAEEQLPASVTQNLISNPLFLDHDGLTPEGWTVLTPGKTLVEADPAVKGNVLRLYGNGADNPKLGYTVNVDPGQRLGFGLKFHSTAERNVEAYFVAGDETSTTHLAGIRRWWGVTDDFGYYWFENVVPDGVTQVTMIVRAEGQTLSVAQPGIFKMMEI